MSKPKINTGLSELLVFWIPGIAFGIWMMCAAWDHNPQGEFHNENGVEWGNLLGIGLGWFVAVSGIPTLIWATLKLMERFPRR